MGRTIGIGHESQGLFHLNSTPSSTICTSTDAPLLVHRRLSHPNISKLRMMVYRFSSFSSLECESCQVEEHTCVSFPKSLDSPTKSSFEVVHIDVWGSSRTMFTLGFRYFVTFIDDFSRCTWLFLMKSWLSYFPFSKSSLLRSALNLTLLSASYAVIMHWNTSMLLSLLFYPYVGSFISLLMLTLLNKMGWLNVRIVTWLRQLTLFFSNLKFLNVFGGCYLNRLLFDESHALFCSE